MSTRKCFLMFQANPIIAAVRNPKDIHDAIASDTQIIFLLGGNIYNLKKMVEYVNHAGKYAFVHLDLIKGYAQDNYFIKYLKEEITPTGIISTKNSLVTRAKQEGLMTIQRLFLLDSSAMDVSINSAKKIRPDAVEILPGLVPKIIHSVKKELTVPIITGGFIETEEEVRSCIDAGAISASTSYKPLWDAFSSIKSEQKNREDDPLKPEGE
ncbi:glycerol uptake operon antiterminator [Eubacterium maltosivorans]|uniref:glycerol-3-phosphate responsive antiterminator n=1 Tax=Eubacterium maltosivorans TaxID=2041044 RepID=UPI0008857AAB|nr:glycerol-3-phosphate responsive antiterminator [Eubacterium maltosivorans]WPK79394.1 Glycerol uptake operon antiterminator regulatory protein [Eubacterium maltosivorans]SDP42095.1 glycerol uptake operon antiterminator [Eubacterium maltosivorans]